MAVYKHSLIRVLLPLISSIFIFIKSADFLASTYKYKYLEGLLELLGLWGEFILPMVFGGVVNFLVIGFMKYVVREPYTPVKSLWVLMAGIFSSILGIFLVLFLASYAGF